MSAWKIFARQMRKLTVMISLITKNFDQEYKDFRTRKCYI